MSILCYSYGLFFESNKEEVRNLDACVFRRLNYKLKLIVTSRTTLIYPLKQPYTRYNKKIESGGGVRITEQLVVFAGDFMAL